VRVKSRRLGQATELPGAPAIHWRDRRGLVKCCATEIQYGRGKAARRGLDRKLIAATQARRCSGPPPGAPAVLAWRPRAGAPRWTIFCR
jgi:hypothetical protein